MADKGEQIHIRISAEAKARLVEACKQRDVTQGDVVEEALRRLFGQHDEETSRFETILVQLATIRQILLAQETPGQHSAPVPEAPAASNGTHVEPQQAPPARAWNSVYGAHWLEDHAEAPQAPVVRRTRGWLRRS